jgi:hypothetical protein
MPDEPEVRGLLPLVLDTDARRATRVGADGRLLRLGEQDRSQWDRAAISEARTLVGDPPAAQATGPLRPPGGDRFGVRQSGELRRNGLAEDRPATTCARAVAVAGGGAQPGRGALDGFGA